MSAAATTVRVLRELEAIDDLEDAWESLLRSSRCNRAFSAFAWYRAACECYEGITPLLLLAERNGAPVAILPLVIGRDEADDRMKAARFATKLSDYNDIIAREDECDACILIMRHLMSDDASYSDMPCDRIDLNFLRPDSNCMRALEALCGEEAMANCFDERRFALHIDLEGLGGDYLRLRSRASRKDLYRSRREAERAGATASVLDPATFPAVDLPALFLTLHEERFGGATRLTSGSHRAFIERVLPGLFASGKSVAVVLSLDGHIVAVDICHVGPRSLCSWNGGFARSAAPLSPGALVVDAGIQAALARGFSEYDMLRGSERYKGSVCNGRRYLGRVVR